MSNKVCNQCKEEKSLSEFGIDNHMKDGYRSRCKICTNATNRKYAAEHKDIIQARNAKKRESRQMYYQSEVGIESSRRSHLKRNFNITLEDYNLMLENQDGKCQICGKTEMNNKNKVLCVDHNHETGNIRGLLCGLCNSGIGNLMDNKQLLINAIKYLKKYE